MATAAAEAAGLPGGGMAFSTVAVICGVGMVGNSVGGSDVADATDATEEDAGDLGVDDAGSGVTGGGDAVGVGSDMTSSMMVAGVDATEPSSSRMWSSITGSSITASSRLRSSLSPPNSSWRMFISQSSAHFRFTLGVQLTSGQVSKQSERQVSCDFWAHLTVTFQYTEVTKQTEVTVK